MNPSIDSSRAEPNPDDTRRAQSNQPPAKTSAQRSDPPRDNQLEQIVNLPPRDIGSAAVVKNEIAAQEVRSATLPEYNPPQARGALGRVADFFNDRFPLYRDVSALVSDLCRNPFNVEKTGGLGMYCRTLLWNTSTLVGGLVYGGFGGITFACLAASPTFYFKVIDIPGPLLGTLAGIAGAIGLAKYYRASSAEFIDSMRKDLGDNIRYSCRRQS